MGDVKKEEPLLTPFFLCLLANLGSHTQEPLTYSFTHSFVHLSMDVAGTEEARYMKNETSALLSKRTGGDRPINS